MVIIGLLYGYYMVIIGLLYGYYMVIIWLLYAMKFRMIQIHFRISFRASMCYATRQPEFLEFLAAGMSNRKLGGC